ncbi:hypothetical protein DTL42_24125 [Bremerella cremea]|uniref:Uncharacterized protein n=1 Tax=Bremerella cremea TaxID=1031537 RepID=A0A368KIS5_9BACT|nr:hypothetical protein [Bremerella cremea]RCS40466.1 hypothetical protein DTL42_24125 [Bremerella cremea]
MPSLNDLLWGLVAPLFAAAGLRLVLAFLSDWLFARPVDKDSTSGDAAPAKRVLAWETCLPLALGAGLGYFFLPLGPWVPEVEYEWIAAAVGLAVVASTVVGFLGNHWSARFIGLPIFYAATAVAVGYALMPTWDDLWPDYRTYLVFWCLGAWLLSVAIDQSSLPASWPFAIVVLGTCLATSGVVLLSESMRFAQISGLTVGVVLGLTVVGLILRRPLLNGLGLPIVVYLGGMLLIAQTNSFSEVPFLCYWLPMGGLLLAVVTGQLVSRTSFPKLHATSMILAAAIPSTVAVIMAVVATMPE